MKRTIKLGESELKRMIAKSVRRVLRESNESNMIIWEWLTNEWI